MDISRLKHMAQYDAEARAELERYQLRSGQISISPEGHRLEPHHARQFIFAGKALFTIANRESGKRFTFKIKQSKRTTENFWVSVLTGADNESSYSTLGFAKYQGDIRSSDFQHTAKEINPDALSAKSWRWFYWMLKEYHNFPENFEIWHEGRCGRCGKALTVPTSIRIGFGPDCAELLGLGHEFYWTAILKNGQKHTLQGASEHEARRNLRDILGCGRLPNGTRFIRDGGEDEQEST